MQKKMMTYIVIIYLHKRKNEVSVGGLEPSFCEYLKNEYKAILQFIKAIVCTTLFQKEFKPVNFYFHKNFCLTCNLLYKKIKL